MHISLYSLCATPTDHGTQTPPTSAGANTQAPPTTTPPTSAPATGPSADPPTASPTDPSTSTPHTSPPTAPEDPGPTQEPETHGPNSPAARAFRRHYADLAKAIAEPLPITADLYAAGYITRETRDRVFLQTLTPTEKNLVLLDAIERRIFTDPSSLWTLVATLEGDNVLKPLADRLRSTYCK